MSKEFVGHLALVTGGASGIGAQICRDLAAAGASVVVADRHAKPAKDLAVSLPTGDGSLHLVIQLDVSKKTEVENALSQVIKTYGRTPDLIVNNAGIDDGKGPLEKISEEDFDRVMNINLKGTFLVTQVFGKALLDVNKPGSIVNVSSILAYMSWENMSHYSASKAAVMHLSKVAAKEWGPRGIRVNSVHPGLTETPMTIAAKADFKTYEKTASLRRVGQPKDISDAVLFLLSEKSAFITGSQLEISGQCEKSITDDE